MSTPLRSGDIVANKYRVDRVIGEGGMGVVVAATHEQLDQRVALKFLLPNVAMDPQLVQRFMREARAAVKIQSEHVARVLDVGTLESGSPYMVMEYLEGEDLAQVIESRGALPIEESVTHLLQACEAIAEAHALGIVHRDLKPANLFLARRPSGKPIIKVLDFGISKAPSTKNEAVLTTTSTLMGSPLYMSPEQLTAAPTVDARADIWAMGVVLYEMLTGRVPFVADTMPELVGVILMKPHSPIDAARYDVPVGLTALVDRCLQKDATRRFSNVAELARAIAPFGPARSDQSVERIEHLLGTSGASTELGGASVAPPRLVGGVTFSPTTSQSSTGRPTARRFVLSASVVLAAGGAALFLAFRGGRGDTVRPTPVRVVSTLPSSPPSLSSVSAAPTQAPSLAAVPTTSSPPAERPTASSLPSTLPSKASGPSHRPDARPPPSASASASAASPTCHVVSYYDADGTKHFKQDCP